MSDLNELADRVEALDRPSREVDAEIAVTVLGMERDGSMFFGKDEDYVLERDYYALDGGPRELPAYTASLDAAMSLVPEGWHVSINAGRINLVVLTGESDDPMVPPPDIESSTAATPALALVAASLRAIHLQGEG